MKLMPALVGEAIGVFGLSFVGVMAIHMLTAPGVGPVGLVGIALAHGLMLAIMVTAFFNVSGGHINPAVTIGLCVGGKIKPLAALAYVIAQVIGGLIAGLVIMAIFGADGAKIVADGTPAVGNTSPLFGHPYQACLAEAVTTFFLLIAVWGTAVDPRAPKVGGFAIGLTVGVDILAIGPLTGAAMNPARALGPALASLFGGATYDWADHWIYWVGPIAGGIVASVIYRFFIYPKEPA